MPTVHIMTVTVLNELKYETLLKDLHALTTELDRYTSYLCHLSPYNTWMPRNLRAHTDLYTSNMKKLLNQPFSVLHIVLKINHIKMDTS